MTSRHFRSGFSIGRVAEHPDRATKDLAMEMSGRLSPLAPIADRPVLLGGYGCLLAAVLILPTAAFAALTPRMASP